MADIVTVLVKHTLALLDDKTGLIAGKTLTVITAGIEIQPPAEVPVRV